MLLKQGRYPLSLSLSLLPGDVVAEASDPSVPHAPHEQRGKRGDAERGEGGKRGTRAGPMHCYTMNGRERVCA